MRLLLFLPIYLAIILPGRAFTQQNSNFIEIPLMTKRIVSGISSNQVIELGPNLVVTKLSQNKILVSTSTSASAGVFDSLRFIKETDTLTVRFLFINPTLVVKFDDFNPHSGTYIFLKQNPPKNLIVNIASLTDEEKLVNKVELSQAIFCLYDSTDFRKSYKVNNNSLDQMFKDLTILSRPGYVLTLSRITLILNGRKYKASGSYFTYLFK